MLNCVALAAAAVAFIAACNATSNISNASPRRSTDGKIMDAHDGNIWYDGKGTYFWFAASYGECTEPSGSSGCSDAGPNVSCEYR